MVIDCCLYVPNYKMFLIPVSSIFYTQIPTIDSHTTEKQLCDIDLTTRPWVAPKGKSAWRESGRKMTSSI